MMTVTSIMRVQQIWLARLNETLAEMTNDHEFLGEWLYFITVMGKPSATEPWGFQLDGHVLNCSDPHVYALIRRRLMVPCSRARRGRYGSARVPRNSYLNFLKSRRYS